MSTEIVEIDALEWAERILRLYPPPWSADTARKVGAVLYALAKAIGGELEVANRNLQYVLDTCRLETAREEGLERYANDYFGATPVAKPEITKAPGESDEALKARIRASLLLPLGTRAALRELITRLTGNEPRIMEPWNLNDTGAWDCISFWDIDTVQNPARYADPALRYQGFIESALPSFGGQGDNPVYGYDAGACYDSPSGFYLTAKSTWFLTVKLLDALINKTKVFGTIVWRKYRSQPLTNWPLGGTKIVGVGQSFKEIEVYPPFSGYFSILTSANWNTDIAAQYISSSKFRLNFNVEAPEGAFVDWVAAPITLAGYATVPITLLADHVILAMIPELAGRNIFVATNWTTNYWLADSDPSQKRIEFSVEAPQSAQMSYAFIPPESSGWLPVEPGTTQTIIPLSVKEPFQAFVIPTWNTACDVDKSSDHLSVNYQTPPDVSGRIYWGVHES